ncbi:MAG: Rieske 2Fe-2S domain-containing protein [Thermoguttaceae bacterium]
MNVDRRGWLRSVFGSALGVVLVGFGGTVALWAAAVARFLTPNVADRSAGRFKAGPPAQYAAGHVETRYQPTHGVWIVHGTRGDRSGFFALQARCTHLGCATRWDETRREFRCPCHGSVYTCEGRNIAGPAPRPLERCAIRLSDDGQLEVDTARTFQEQLGQWDEPESFVDG